MRMLLDLQALQSETKKAQDPDAWEWLNRFISGLVQDPRLSITCLTNNSLKTDEVFKQTSSVENTTILDLHDRQLPLMEPANQVLWEEASESYTRFIRENKFDYALFLSFFVGFTDTVIYPKLDKCETKTGVLHVLPSGHRSSSSAENLSADASRIFYFRQIMAISAAQQIFVRTKADANGLRAEGVSTKDIRDFENFGEMDMVRKFVEMMP